MPTRGRCLHLDEIAAGTAAPSVTLRELCDLGRTVRDGYMIAESDVPMSDHMRAALAAMAEARGDAYDGALSCCLGWVGDVAALRSDADARILEARYIDGTPWGAVADAEGTAVATVVKRARRALRWLDRRAGFVV